MRSILLGVRHQYRPAQAVKALLREKPASGFEPGNLTPAIGALYDFLARPAFAHLNLNQRLFLGMGLLPHFIGHLPTPKESLIGMATWLAGMVVPLALCAGLIAIRPDAGKILSERGSDDAGPATAERLRSERVARFKQRMAQQRAARVARLAANPKGAARFTALEAAIRDATDFEDEEDALRLARLYYAEAAALAPGARERAYGALFVVRAQIWSEEDDSPQAANAKRRLLREAESILHQSIAQSRQASSPPQPSQQPMPQSKHGLQPPANRKDALFLAEIKVKLVHQQAESALPLLQQAVALYETCGEPYAGDLLDARQELAVQLDEAGQSALAEKQLVLASGVNAPALTKQDAYPRGAEVTYDLRGSLLLLEVETHLGHAAQAAKLKQALDKRLHKERDSRQHCYFHFRAQATWESDLNHALEEIERREFPCKERPIAGCD